MVSQKTDRLHLLGEYRPSRGIVLLLACAGFLLVNTSCKGGPPDFSTVQNAERCGETVPAFDPQTNAIASNWYQDPDLNFVPPFAACKEALQSLSASRPACDTVADQKTLLVSKRGDQDPRWQSETFSGPYTSIQDAIDDAKHCDTIVVRPGIYQEYLSIEGKDVRLISDHWNEAGTVEDGNERENDYVAERIDLLHYYETGERNVLDSRTPLLKPLKRTVRTILQGGGYAEGPDLGGTIARNHDDAEDPNRGCGNRRPMVNFVAGTTRNTHLDGFTVRLMPEQDHTIPGHGHTLQARGSSPIIRHNLIYNNGSTGVGVHASWKETTPVSPPCEATPTLAQETFSNKDYRAANIQYRPVPLVYDNISYQNNGLGLGNNHYSCAAMIANEVFWNAVPGEEDAHQSPGIGTRHGAKTYLQYNVAYENAWTGIAVRQGFLQPKEECAADAENCNHIDERTQAVVLENIVFNNGFGETPEEYRGGIALDGAGLPDDPVLVQGNIVYQSQLSGIGVRNEYAGQSRGFVLDNTYATIVGNRAFGNARHGITCKGSEIGDSHCKIVGNDAFWNATSGINIAEGGKGAILNNVAACNSKSGITSALAVDAPIINNIAYFNVNAGILDPNATHNSNLLSGNGGWNPLCDGPEKNATSCKAAQYGSKLGGTAPSEMDLFADPLFANASEGDFELLPGSPAIDSGQEIASYFDGWSKKGAALDRGSNER